MRPTVRMRGVQWFVFAALGCLMAREAEAQTCVGGLPLQRGSWLADGAFLFGRDPTPTISGLGGTTVSYGPVFGQFTTGATQISDYQYSIVRWGAAGGAQIPAGPVSACLIYEFQRSVSDDLGGTILPSPDIDIRVTSIGHTGMLALGVRLWSGGRWAFAPTIAGALSVGTTEQDNGLFVERSQGGLFGLRIGTGIVFKDRLSVTPALWWPLYSSQDAEAGLTGSITVSFSLWRRSR